MRLVAVMAVSVGLLLYCNCRLQWCFLLMDMLLNKTARETNLVLISTRFRKKVFCSRKQLWHIVPAGIFTEWIRWIVTIIIFSRYMLPTCIWDFWTETRFNLSLSVRRNLQLDLCTTEERHLSMKGLMSDLLPAVVFPVWVIDVWPFPGCMLHHTMWLTTAVLW